MIGGISIRCLSIKYFFHSRIIHFTPHIVMAAAPQRRRPDMDDFDKITLTEIGHRFKYDTRGTIDWCRQNGLLASRFHCEVYIDAQGNLDAECNVGNLRNKIDVRGMFSLPKLQKNL